MDIFLLSNNIESLKETNQKKANKLQKINTNNKNMNEMEEN